MDIIVLTILGVIIAVLMLYWFNRHLKSASLLMKENKDVKPLFKHRSAELKYQHLRQHLQGNDNALAKLQQLYLDFKNQLINIHTYHTALEEMEQQYPTH